MRRRPAWRLVSLKVPDASTATYASYPLAHCRDRRERRANFKRYPGEDQLLATRLLDGFRDGRVVERVDGRAVDDFKVGSASTSSGNIGRHMLSRAVVVTTMGSFNALAALARETTLCFSSPVE